MAERRMFTEKITDSDAFLDMPSSTQCLYFQLNMKADDDGFVNNPKKIVRAINVSEDDLKLLLMKRFIIGFESGVIVIKHWRMHNYIRKDRHNDTVYQEELALLDIKENGSYTLKNDVCQPLGNQMTTTWQPNDNQMSAQVRLGKVRLGKDSKDIGVFDAYSGDDIALKNALIEYEKMRNLKKWNMTDHSRKLLCRELDKLKAQGHDIIECLNTAILNNWKSVYAPKESKHKVEPIPEYESDTKNLSDEELEALKKRLKGMK